VQKVAVIKGLQAEIAEFQIARGVQRLAQARQVEFGQPLVQQLGRDAALDELRKIPGVTLGHLRLRHFLAQDLDADGIEQQPRGDVAVGGIFFDQRTRRQDRRLADFLDRHAVVEVLQRLVENNAWIDRITEAVAASLEQVFQPGQVYRPSHAVLDCVQLGGGGLVFLLGQLKGARLGTLLAVKHVSAGYLVLARAHQRQLDLVLDVFNMEGAAAGLAPRQSGDHSFGQPGNQFANARRGRTLTAFNRQKRLGHGNRDLARVETDHRAVAANDAVFGIG